MLSLAALVAAAAACTPASQRRRHDAQWRAATARPPAAADDRALTAAILDREALIALVVARNPEVGAAQAAWRAAASDYDRVTAWADPSLTLGVAPLSVAGDARFGTRVSVAQRVPVPGARRLAGEVALAMADAAAGDVDAVRVELARMASDLYDQHYLVARARAINDEHQRLIRELHDSALARYEVGRAAQQDPIQAELELARLADQRITLDSDAELVVAAINRLLHRRPSAPLPPPPAELDVARVPAASADELEARALAARPDRVASSARVRAAGAAIDLAERRTYPELSVMASYDTMPVMPAHRWMVGVMIDLPVQRAPRRAAVARARAEAEQRRLLDDALADTIRTQVHDAHRRVVEAGQVVAVYEDRLVPAARARVEAAIAGFVAGQLDFGFVIDAERDLRQAELDLESARARLSRRHAELSAAIGIAAQPEGGTP